MLDPVDSVAWLYVVAVLIGIPLLGWVFMVLDYRAYVRSLRRAIAVVRQYTFDLPEWVKDERPECFRALGLVPPCTKEEVLAAYRRLVKELHPDRGGDRRRFNRLQRHFEEAIALVEETK